jgi:general stress protein 26
MATTQKKLEELDKLIEGIETAMFTTRRHDGHLVSRPMATQEPRHLVGSNWFYSREIHW